MKFKLTPEIANKIAVWAVSGDTGISSKTIARIALGLSEEQGRWCFDIPGDSGDFGRCYQLLKAVPELRDALPLVAEVFPKYRPLVEVWDEITVLYEQDQAEEPVYEMVSIGRGRPRQRCRVNGRACYDKLLELYPACMEAGGYVKNPYFWEKKEHADV